MIRRQASLALLSPAPAAKPQPGLPQSHARRTAELPAPCPLRLAPSPTPPSAAVARGHLRPRGAAVPEKGAQRRAQVGAARSAVPCWGLLRAPPLQGQGCRHSGMCPACTLWPTCRTCAPPLPLTAPCPPPALCPRAACSAWVSSLAIYNRLLAERPDLVQVRQAGLCKHPGSFVMDGGTHAPPRPGCTCYAHASCMQLFWCCIHKHRPCAACAVAAGADGAVPLRSQGRDQGGGAGLLWPPRPQLLQARAGCFLCVSASGLRLLLLPAVPAPPAGVACRASSALQQPTSSSPSGG